MQKRKLYSGTIDVGEMQQRPVAWGGTTKESMYIEWVDILNQIIAAFLSADCGVDASYIQKSGDEYPWLYIYGVPFLAYAMDSVYTVRISAPFVKYDLATAYDRYLGGYLMNTKNQASLSNNKVTYSFGLNFAGKAANGFLLRAGYVSSSGAYSLSAVGEVFAPCTSVANGNRAVAWIKRHGNTTVVYWQANVIELSGGRPVLDGYDSEPFSYTCGLNTKKVMKNDGKFPLVPVFFGKYKADGLYLLPLHYGVPDSGDYSTSKEDMTEFTVASKTFINLNKGYLASNDSGYLSIGILDVT